MSDPLKDHLGLDWDDNSEVDRTLVVFHLHVIVASVNNESMPDEGELAVGIYEALHRDWFTVTQGDEYEIRAINPGMDVLCDECDEIIDPDEQNHIFDGLLCDTHLAQAYNEYKADQHYREAEA